MSCERRRRFLTDVSNAERVDETRQIVLLTARNLLVNVPPDLAELPRNRSLGPRAARRDDQRFERGRLEMIEIGEIVNETLLDQLIDQRLAQAFDVHGVARGEVLEAPAKPGGTRRVLAAPNHLFFIASKLAAADLAGRRHHPWN
jgi:hypothetical protein